MVEPEVQALLVRYCELIDAGDFEGLGELFRDGRMADQDGNAFAQGSVAVARYFREHVRLYNGSPRTKHLVLNTVVEHETPDVVIVRSSYLVLQALDDRPLAPIVTGRYHDTFRTTDSGVWRFEERRFAIDLSGDLSRHLRT